MVFQDKSQVARPLEAAGYQSWSGHMSPGNFPSFVFELPRQQFISQRVYFSVSGEHIPIILENKVIRIIVVFIFSMLKIKTDPEQKQKVTAESTPLSIGKTGNNLWSHRLYETIQFQVTNKCPDNFFSPDKCPGEK